LEGKQEDGSSKLNERTRNVYENKGMLPIARLRRGRYTRNGPLAPVAWLRRGQEVFRWSVNKRRILQN
jgi:hypothetical protein